MRLQIFGPGCRNCKKSEQNAMQALTNLNIQAEVEKVTDINQIADFGVTATPALAIDGKVKFSGKIPSVQEIEEVLKSN